jgi:hypothetical protein
LALILLATVGLVHVFLGEWRPSPGGNPWLVPLICYLVIIPTALLMAHGALRAGATEEHEQPAGLAILATAVWAIAFFYVVTHIGLAAGPFLSMLIAMAALSPRPVATLKILVPLAAVVSGAFWVMFTQFAPILLRGQWLF